MLKPSWQVSAEAQARLDADQAVLDEAESEIIAGQMAQAAKIAAAKLPNESDIASMPPGWRFPIRE